MLYSTLGATLAMLQVRATLLRVTSLILSYLLMIIGPSC